VDEEAIAPLNCELRLDEKRPRWFVSQLEPLYHPG
jgi:hypothetical protein